MGMKLGFVLAVLGVVGSSPAARSAPALAGFGV